MMKKHIYIIGAVVLLIVVGHVFNNKPQPQVQTSVLPSVVVCEYIVVQIKGEVQYPDIYQLDVDSRVYHLIDLAGGFTHYADYESLNMVEKLRDGMVIHIQSKQSINNQQISQRNNKISINNATESELMQLTGIGEARAKSIVEYRTIHGSFRQLSDLLKISGISESIFNNIIDDICL